MTTAPSDGGPAFPRAAFSTEEGDFFNGSYPGMSLRDYFAGQALAGMAGMVATKEGALGLVVSAEEKNQSPPQFVAIACYELADAMLKERSREADE